MRLSRIVVISAATLAIAACGKKADQPDTGSDTAISENAAANAQQASISGGQGFANTVAASDAFEVQSSQLALTASKSPAIKKFAQAMIDAHTTSTGKLKAAAGAASPAINPDPTLAPDQQQKLDSLKAKTGADFDTEYAADQVAGHEQALAALRSYSASGDVAQLKSFATGAIPTVTAHLNMAKGLKH